MEQTFSLEKTLVLRRKPLGRRDSVQVGRIDGDLQSKHLAPEFASVALPSLLRGVFTGCTVRTSTPV